MPPRAGYARRPPTPPVNACCRRDCRRGPRSASGNQSQQHPRSSRDTSTTSTSIETVLASTRAKSRRTHRCERSLSSGHHKASMTSIAAQLRSPNVQLPQSPLKDSARACHPPAATDRRRRVHSRDLAWQGRSGRRRLPLVLATGAQACGSALQVKAGQPVGERYGARRRHTLDCTGGQPTP